METASTPAEMLAIGERAAHSAVPGLVIGLVGGLGAGKTHWTKGFVSGLGSQAEVTSPTFGLLHEYTDGRIPVFHLDLYRMESAEEAIDLGWDELLEQDAVIIAEWADRFPDLFPAHARWLHFSISADGSRSVTDATTRREPS